MAETDNIARMASKVSDDIFDTFGWVRIGGVNANWKCVAEDHKKATHPSDVVFAYDDPYRPERVFWNVDLKSYAAGTINATKLAAAVSSLAKSVECANVSGEWQALYGDDESNWRCDGLLFVYNHDGAFDRDFQKLLGEVDASHFRLPPKRRMAILGPPDVAYLVNVAHDLTQLRGKKKLPLDQGATEFWYPDLVRPKRRPQSRSAATIEMLTGPWITLLVPPEHNGGCRKFVVYYRGSGDSVDEFKYLIDSFFRFQMLTVDSNASVDVRLVEASPLAVPNFSKAKSAISTSLYGLAEKRLAAVRCETIPDFVRHFSEVEIGMEER